MQVGIVVETAEAREVHDIALLIGFGAAAVNPYLALDTVQRARGPDPRARSSATSTRSKRAC